MTIFKNAINAQEVKENIYSLFKEEERASDYDEKVKGYDTLIGNKTYNKLIWRNDVKNYHDFCKEALDASANGTVLDAGCGSLVFTAQTYADSTNKQIILLDRSLGMLEAASQRLIALCGEVPKHIMLLQGDVFDLPFDDKTFDVVMSQGLLHMFEDKKAFLNELERVLKPEGNLYFTSLVANNLISKLYLSLLKKAGEVATIDSSQTLHESLQSISSAYSLKSIGNMAYFQKA